LNANAAPRPARELQAIVLRLSHRGGGASRYSFRSTVMAKYGKQAQSSVKRAMHKKKKGTLSSGKSKKKVKSKKQAVAIGLSKARKKGAKVPGKKKTSRKKSTSRKKKS